LSPKLYMLIYKYIMLEKPKKNTIHEQTSDTPSTSSGKLEITKDTNLDQTTKILTNLIEGIQDGEGVNREDVNKLKKALDNIEVNLGPYPFPVTRLINLSKEELESQAMILQEIYQGNFSNLNQLKIITPLISKQLEKVNGDLDLESLTSAEGLTLPQTVGGDLDLFNLTSALGLTLPQTVGGDLDLFNLTSALGLTLPQTVNGYLSLHSLTSAAGLTLPQTVGGDLDLFNLTSALGLTLPQTVNGYLSLHSLTSALGLTLPQTVNGYLSLRSLTSAAGLTLPPAVGENIYLFSLTPEEIQKLKEDRPDLAGKIKKKY